MGIQGALSQGAAARILVGAQFLGSGALGTPALVFPGSLTTGLYQPAADTWAIQVSGAEVTRVDSTGLGVGTSPGARFHALSDAAGKIGGIIQGAAGQTANLFEVQINSGAIRAQVDASGHFRVQGLNSTNNVEIGWIGDADTGFTRTAANTFTISAGGAGFSVNGTASTKRIIAFQGGSNSSPPFGFGTSGGDVWGIFAENSSTGRSMAIGGASTTVLRIMRRSSTVGQGNVAVLQDTTTAAGNRPIVRVIGNNCASSSAGVEHNDVWFDWGGNTFNRPTGAVTSDRIVRIEQRTLTFSGASTITTAASVAILGPPVAGTNATITDAYALWIESGDFRTEGDILMTEGQKILFDTDASGTQSIMGGTFAGADILDLNSNNAIRFIIGADAVANRCEVNLPGSSGNTKFNVLNSAATDVFEVFDDGTTTITGTLTVGTAPNYTVTNVTTDRTYDANSTTLDEIADVLGSVIADLTTIGLFQ